MPVQDMVDPPRADVPDPYREVCPAARQPPPIRAERHCPNISGMAAQDVRRLLAVQIPHLYGSDPSYRWPVDLHPG
jgi:hypothetical protein